MWIIEYFRFYCVFRWFKKKQNNRIKHSHGCACARAHALVSSRLILPWTGDHGLSCTSPCEHEKVMVFLSQPIWVNVVSPSQVPSDAFYFPECLLWTDWSWQALTFRNVPINGIHGCWYALCWYMKSSAAAVHRWHLNPSSLLIMMSFHCAVK